MSYDDKAVRVNKSLFDIHRNYVYLMDRIEEADGEITEDIEELLIKSEEEFKQKAVSYIGIINEKKSQLSIIDDEIKRLQAIKKSTARSVELLSDRLLDALQEFGYDDKGIFRYEIETFRLSTRRSNPCLIPQELELKQALIKKLMDVEDVSEVAKSIKDLEDDGKMFIPMFLHDANSEASDVKLEEELSLDSPSSVNTELNKVETDFIQNNLTYNVKFHAKYSDMIRIINHASSIMLNPYNDIEMDIAIPKKEASAVVKSSGGFRIAKVTTNYSLTIK